MDEQGLRDEAVGILNAQLDDAIAVRDFAMRARWVALRGEGIALPPLFERTAAHLQAHVDRVADQVLALGAAPLEAPRLIVPASGLDPRSAAENVQRLCRMLARLMRATRLRSDVARSIGDTDSANMLRQAQRALELLLWQVDYLAHAEE